MRCTGASGALCVVKGRHGCDTEVVDVERGSGQRGKLDALNMLSGIDRRDLLRKPDTTHYQGHATGQH